MQRAMGLSHSYTKPTEGGMFEGRVEPDDVLAVRLNRR